MTRGQRRDIWPVFEEYRNLLEASRLREPEDAMRDAAALLERGEVSLPYRAVLVDEAQDMSTVAFRLVRAMIRGQREDDLFIVGDGHQRIYRRKVVLGHAGVNVVGRSRRLRINYRTTDEIRRYAVALLEGGSADDLDGGEDSRRGYKSLFHGAPPTVQRLGSFDAEVEALARFVREGDVRQTCLVARTRNLVDQYAAALEALGIPLYRISRDLPEDQGADGLRVATMHRVKGLEFDRMAIAGLGEEVMPLRGALGNSGDPSVRAEAEWMERALLYVAATRARRELLLTCHGPPSPWLREVAE